RGQLAGMATTLLYNVSLISNLVIIGFLFVRVHPALLLLPLFAIPSMVGSALSQAAWNKAFDKFAEPARLASHLFTIGTSPAAGKELRVFGLRAEIQRRYEVAWGVVCGILRRASIRATLISTGGWLIFGAGYVVAMVLVVRQ